MEKKENKMGTMPIGKLLVSMSGPAIISMLINSLYNIVDSIFVAQIGEDALTAVSIVFPIQMLIVSFAVGTGVGINSLISRRLGARMFEQADSAATDGIKLGFVNWILFAVIGIFFAEPFMRVFSTDETIISYGVSYLSIVTIFSLFVHIEIPIEKIFQATGNMIVPMIAIIVGAVSNIILDPILIFGWFGLPAMGIKGAAVATVMAQFICLAVSMCILIRGEHQVNIHWKRLKVDWQIVKEIYAVGGPSIIMQALSSVMLFGMNAILASFSSTAVAVLGVYGKLQSFVFMPTFGINQGSLPIMGYNYGACRKKRMFRCFRMAMVAGMVIMTAGLIIFQVFPEQLLMLFNASDNMMEMGIRALRTISICFIPAAFGIITAGLFQATGHGMMSMWGSIIRQFAGTLPCAYLFGKIGGLEMVWFSFAAAEILGTIYYAVILKYVNDRSFKKMECGTDEQ